MEDRLHSSEELRRALRPKSVGTVTAPIAPAAPYLSRNYVEIPVADSTAPVETLPSVTESSLPDSESINAWPDDAAEASFLAESRENRTAVPAPIVSEAVITAKPLPRLDELVERIPAEARELLEELFRAKFTTVRRVKPTDLKAT